MFQWKHILNSPWFIQLNPGYVFPGGSHIVRTTDSKAFDGLNDCWASSLDIVSGRFRGAFFKEQSTICKSKSL